MNVSLGKLGTWVKQQVKRGNYENDSELVRDAVRRLKNSQRGEPRSLQRLMDDAETSGFEKFAANDWAYLRRLAKTGSSK